MARIGIIGITRDEKERIRRAVKLAMAYWPNAHLGDQTPREDMRAAFSMIRHAMMERMMPLSEAIWRVESHALSHQDM